MGWVLVHLATGPGTMPRLLFAYSTHRSLPRGTTMAMPRNDKTARVRRHVECRPCIATAAQLPYIEDTSAAWA